MSFQENFKRIREAKGLTQEDIAARLSISQQAVSKWETGGECRTTRKSVS